VARQTDGSVPSTLDIRVRCVDEGKGDFCVNRRSDALEIPVIVRDGSPARLPRVTKIDALAAEDAVREIDPQDPALVSPVIEEFRRHHPKASTARIAQAFEIAAAAHKDQKRKSGAPYITHPIAVASVLAQLSLDDITLAAAILHDAVEDTGVTLDDITAQFGSDVAAIVDGVTKLERIHFDSKEAQQAATMRKMLVAMAKDVRVLLIKLADRLHNMRTIDAVADDWRRRRTAQETLDIYAPLAHRLGIGEVKHELEELSFRVLEPRKFEELQRLVASRSPQKTTYLTNLIEQVTLRLAELGIDDVVVTAREKHLWSIYETMVTKGKEFDDIHDLVGVRIIVDSIKDCYAALGTIHASYKPVQGRFKDYVAMPKFNLYQSLHTTVIGPEGKNIECQIRTREMHQIAEYGIAAHWAYKDAKRAGKDAKMAAGITRLDASNLAWLQRLAEAQPEADDPKVFLETIKVDLDQDEVFVFTPKGKVVTLPVRATPIDFAYAIHTDVGHRCIGARVNGRLSPLDAPLSSGETVEIITSKVETAQPSRDWLHIVITPRARNKIRQWFSKERRDDAIENGREELVKALRKEALPVQKIQSSPVMLAVIADLGLDDLEQLYLAIGENHIGADHVARRLASELRGGEHEEQLPAPSARSQKNRRARGGVAHAAGVHVEGLDDLMVRLARCCTPVPGDEIIGFVTRGRGVSVHRSDCANSRSLQVGEGSRAIEVEWDQGVGSRKNVYVVSIEVQALDRARLLADVARVLSDNHVNVLGCTTHTGSDRVAHQRFDFELADPSHLDAILHAVRNVDSVFDSFRVLPGNGRRAE
jgi:GTP diphosphokinase / guanosine-3',5'-bis(diphosphate) 3'-diphosphatase